MIDDLKIYCDIDHHGNFIGQEEYHIINKIIDRFSGQMIVITVRGIPRDVSSLRKWYFSGILPDFLGVMKAYGHKTINPRSKEQRDEAHDLFKKKFIPPLIDELGNYINMKGEQVEDPVHTTRNLGYMGWNDFIRSILEEIEDKYGVVLKPKYKKG